MARYLPGLPTFEGSHSFVLRTKNRWSKLHHGVHHSGTLSFGSGDRAFPLAVEIDTRNPNYPLVRLTHKSRTEPATTQRYEVRLKTTPQPFGGLRWWFACPHTGKSAVCLVLPYGCERFLSRNVYNLAYASQRQKPMGRAQIQGMKLYAKLGGTGNWLDGPRDKPRHMRWVTYWRETERLLGYIQAFHEAWLPGAQRLLDRLQGRKR